MIAWLFFTSSLLFSTFTADTTNVDLLIGSYTAKGNAGIEAYDFDMHTGQAKATYKISNPNASYLVASADQSLLFAVTEEGGGRSSVTAYRRDVDGQYEKLNTQPTIGQGPCHMIYRESSKTLYTANYSSGSLTVFRTENGWLSPAVQHITYQGSGPNKDRQTAPHAHQTMLSPDQQFLYVTDLGTDMIHQHRINTDGTVEEKSRDIAVTPGSGARHIAFNKDGNYAYLISELSGTVDIFSVKEGQFKPIQRILADTSSSKVKGSGHIQLSPSGKWLLVSNRVSSEEVVIFAIQSDGRLQKTFHQPVAARPRMFTFDPSGQYLLVGSQDRDQVQVFAFDDRNGTLKDKQLDIPVAQPSCILFVKRQAEVDPEEQLKKQGITLFPPVAPIANYVKYVQSGKLLFLSGHGPDKPEGGQIYGTVGKDLTVEQGQQAARLTGISLISTIKAAVGDLKRVRRIVKVQGLVNSADGFGQQPAVMNGFSNLMVDIFGERGKHARTSVGVNALPSNIAVEIEMIIELKQ